MDTRFDDAVNKAVATINREQVEACMKCASDWKMRRLFTDGFLVVQREMRFLEVMDGLREKVFEETGEQPDDNGATIPTFVSEEYFAYALVAFMEGVRRGMKGSKQVISQVDREILLFAREACAEGIGKVVPINAALKG